MKKVKVAIIDDGVDFNRIGISGIKIDFCEDCKENKCEGNHNEEKLSHGTLCACIIDKYRKLATIEYISLRVLNDEGSGSVDNLLSAIDWCISNDVDIVNCSLGSVLPEDIKKINKIINQGSPIKPIIVAAQSNQGKYTAPACLSNVVGVKHNYKYVNGIYKFKWYPLDDVEIETSGEHVLEISDVINEKTVASNSFAAPVVVAKIAEIIYPQGYLSFYDLLKQLAERAKTVIGEYRYDCSPYCWHKTIDNVSVQWSYEQYSDIFNKWLKSEYEELEVPIVCVSGDVQLKDIFLKLFLYVLENNGYRIILLCERKRRTSDKRAILVPFECNKYSLLYHLEKKFTPDIIIVDSNERWNEDIDIQISKISTVLYSGFPNAEKYKLESLNDIKNMVNDIYNKLV